MTLHTAITAAVIVCAIFGFLGWRLAKFTSHEMPEPPGPRTPVRGPGLDPGGGSEGHDVAAPPPGPLDRFADDIRATLGHPPSTGPNPYDYYTDRHPKPSAPPAGPPNGGGAGLRTPRRTGTHEAPSVKEGETHTGPSYRRYKT